MKFRIRKENMLPHQRQWWDLDNYYKLLTGGYGSGKTYIGTLRLLYLSFVNSPNPVQYVSPTYGLARRTVEPTLRGFLDRAGIMYNENKTHHEYVIPSLNDATIWIASGNDPDSLRGPNLAAAGIDEPFIQSKEVLDQMTARVRVKDAPQREIFLTGTPEELNWGYDIVTDPEMEMDVGVVYGSTRDNPYNAEEYVQNLLNSYTDEMIKAYVDGKFVMLNKGRVYKPFDREINLEKRNDLDLPIIAGLDFNVDYMSAVLMYKGADFVHVFKEIRILGDGNTYDIAERLSKIAPGITVYPDASGKARKSSATKSDHQILRDYGFKVVAKSKNPPVRDRVNTVNRLYLKRLLTIDPSCVYLIKDMERVIWKNGDLDKTGDPSLTHMSDALGYPIEYLFPVRNTVARGIQA